MSKLRQIYLRSGSALFRRAAALEARFRGFEAIELPTAEQTLTGFQAGTQNATTILMVHGYTSDKTVWMRFGQHFSKQYRVVVPDLAGHGDSPYDASWNYSPAAQAQRLADILDGLGIDKAHIVGNSMGGLIAAQFALQHPEKTISLGLIDPAGIDGETPSDFDNALDRGRNAFLVETDADFAEFYPLTMAKPPYLPKIVLAAIAEQYRQRRDRHALIFEHFFKLKFSPEQLQSLRLPVWLLWGAKDRIIHVSATEVWAKHIPQLKLEVMPTIGHIPMMEVPKKSAVSYAAFLDSQ